MPTSLGNVLWLDSSINAKINAQITSDEIIAPKLNSDTFKNLTLTGTKKNIITIKLGTKNGYTNIL